MTERTASGLPVALRDALAQVVAAERRKWQSERERIEAEAATQLVELRVRLEEFDRLAGRVAVLEHRLATLEAAGERAAKLRRAS